MRHIGYTSCKADPDLLWYKAQTNPTDNTRYYAKFAKLDADKNGSVSLEEWTAVGAKKEKPAAE